jgi:hypothetical protein
MQQACKETNRKLIVAGVILSRRAMMMRPRSAKSSTQSKGHGLMNQRKMAAAVLDPAEAAAENSWVNIRHDFPRAARREAV